MRMNRKAATKEQSNGLMEVIIRDKKGETQQYVGRAISTDLPADALGEILCEAINLAWKAGLDPVDAKIEIKFH